MGKRLAIVHLSFSDVTDCMHSAICDIVLRCSRNFKFNQTFLAIIGYVVACQVNYDAIMSFTQEIILKK